MRRGVVPPLRRSARHDRQVHSLDKFVASGTCLATKRIGIGARLYLAALRIDSAGGDGGSSIKEFLLDLAALSAHKEFVFARIFYVATGQGDAFDATHSGVGIEEQLHFLVERDGEGIDAA